MIYQERNGNAVAVHRGENRMDIAELDFSHRMDMELSKHSFPYFFQNVLGMMYPKYMEEWLESMETTDRTVIICSRDHGKSVFMHG